MDIIGKDVEAKRNLSIIRSNPKLYRKIMDSLNIIGFFDNVVEAELFNTDKRLGKVDLSLSDNNGDLYIICSRSNNKNDVNVIRKIGDDIDESYDLSLLKKSDVTNDNIDLCRVDKTYNTRHGRLITDRKTFTTLFLGNTAYQVLSNFDKEVNIEKIVSDINKLEEKPTFKEFIGAFGNAIESDEVDNVLEVNSYSDFERTSTLRLDEKEKGYAKKI